MTLPKSEHLPNDPEKLPPARKRRARRLLAPLDAEGRTTFLADLAHRASPSFDFYLFSLAAGAVMGLGVLLDTPPLLLLGALVAPLMAPAIGLSISTVLGSARFFTRNLIGLLIGSLLAFAMGYLSGYVLTYWTPPALIQAGLHARLFWANFLVLALGAIFSSAALVNKKYNPAVPSVALAYELYLPLVIAGFGLKSGIPHLWPDGLVVFAIHLAWGVLFGAVTLVVLGFRPLTLFGYTVSGALTLLGIILLIGLGGAGAAVGGQIALPTPIPSATPTITPTFTPSATPPPPTETFTPTATFTLTPTVPTPTATITPSPTPLYAIILTTDGLGAVLRSDPGGPVIRSYFDGTLLQVLPGAVEYEGNPWVRVIAPDGVEGWIMQRLLATATPAPNW